MAALVCDICGGKLKVVNGKIAICESCGMEHSIERVREKYKESQTVMHVDNAHLIDNYYHIALDSYDSDNKQETEAYCNKIIEIDSDNTEALFLKGKAVGWQSSIGNFRFKEAAKCFSNAVNSSTSESEKATLGKQVEGEFKGLSTALVNLRCDRFSNSLDSDETNGFIDDLNEMSDAVDLYVKETGASVNKNEVFRNVSESVKNTISIVAVTKVLLEYKVYGDKQAYEIFTRRTDNCVNILETAANLCDDDDDSDVELYNLIIQMLNTVINNNKTDLVHVGFGAYKETPRLSEVKVKSYKNKIMRFEEKINKINSKKGE